MGAWGAWHVDAFLTLCLPSLLSPRNLPVFRQLHRLKLVVFTTRHDRGVMTASPLWPRLAALMPIEFAILPAAGVQASIAMQQRVWWSAIDRVKSDGSYLFFMPPDVVWSDGSMEAIGRAMDAGRRIVIVPWTLRVVAETFAPVARARLAGAQTAGIGGRELAGLALEHLHPLMSAYRLDGRFFPRHPEMLLEPVPGQGLSLRLLASIPTIYRPGDTALNQNKLVVRACRDDELYLPGDSDELFVASLAPLEKDYHFFNRPRRADPVTIGDWWHGYPSGTNDALVRAPFRIHAGEPDAGQWRRAEQRVDQFLRRTVIAREGLEVWRTVASHPRLRRSAEILALALNTGVLARAARRAGPRLVVLPTDEALAPATAALDPLLAFPGRHDLARLIRRQTAPLAEDGPLHRDGDFAMDLVTDAGTMLTLRRENGQLAVGGKPVVEPPIHAGMHTVVVTDAWRFP